MLQDWLEKWGNVVINKQSVTQGTRQRGISRSILNLVNFIESLIIDDKRAKTTINTTTLLSLFSTQARQESK